MKFEDIHGRWQERRLSWAEAAEILGMSKRTFRRRDHYQTDELAVLSTAGWAALYRRGVWGFQVDNILSRGTLPPGSFGRGP